MELQRLSNDDIASHVCNAARDGKLYRLKVFLDLRPVNVSTMVSLHPYGATPLIIACRNGHLDIVKYLIEKHNANIEQVGTVNIKGNIVEDVTPLWCAAASGHLDIVQILIKQNASVNTTTRTLSTPLRAACFEGHFEVAVCLIEAGADIEITNDNGHTCLMIACYKGYDRITEYLLHHGANVNRKNKEGKTALHECAKSGKIANVKLLLKFGAETNYDSRHKTPLVTAACNGHADIVELFISQTDCPRSDKVDALELLGAYFVDRRRAMNKAFKYWERAMQIRYTKGKLPLEKPQSSTTISEYFDCSEFCTMEELNSLRRDPEQMGIQALLLRERILGCNHSETLFYIRYRAALFADSGSYDRCIRLWLYVLDEQQQKLEPLNPSTQNSLLSFVELFGHMLRLAVRNPAVPRISFIAVLLVFERAIKETERAINSCDLEKMGYFSKFRYLIIMAMHLIGFMCLLRPQLNDREEFKFKKAVYRFVHLYPIVKGRWTPLHLACIKNTTSSLGRYPVIKFPSGGIIKLLLEMGADPNAMDICSNTPLHLIAMNRPFPEAAFKILLNHGAHLDNRNFKSLTALDIAGNTPLLDIFPLKYINLQCMCAKVINAYSVPYKGKVHKQLNEFLKTHCTY